MGTMLESLLLWLGLDDPFFKFFISLAGLWVILYGSFFIIGAILGVVLFFIGSLIPSPVWSSNTQFYTGSDKKKGNTGFLSAPDNREKWTRRDVIMKNSSWFKG